MEVNKSSRKPWRQKGLGKARHGTRRSHLFLGGGKLHGPRNPTSYFYMLPFGSRLLGLCSTLSIKLAQVLLGRKIKQSILVMYSWMGSREYKSLHL